MSSIRLPFWLLVFTAALWPHAVNARRSYDYGADTSSILKRQIPGIYPVTGIPTGQGPGGSVPLRQEIRTLEQDPTTWTLYILALDFMQYTNQSELLSWYQVAGIHGRPFEPYDNVQPTSGNGHNGYCTHVSILFPCWHRPYLALYEQVLYDLIQNIASMWPAGATRDQYVAAAVNFRIPYWDWAAHPPAGQSILPSSIGGSPTVTVDGPSGEQLIANPLWDYEFKPLDISQGGLPDAPFNQWRTTMRYPTTKDGSAVSQNNIMMQQLDNNANSLRSRLFNLFTSSQSYSQFSNEAWYNGVDPSSGHDSIESVHDQIHGLTGGGGHMTYIEYSSFDPIFFLHHAMVDRCFAMWQVMYPQTYVVSEPARYSSFTNSAGGMQTSSSDLTPFYRDTNGDFWTPDSVRTTETFGYAYPETANAPGADLFTQVVIAINNLYGASSTAQKRDGSLGSSTVQRREPGTQYSEWIANIKVEKYALGEPFFINLSIGDNFVGSHFVFTKAATSDCSTCDPNQFIRASIPITDALMSETSCGKLASMQPADVKPFLASNLKYTLTRVDSQEVEDGEVPSLTITIVSANVTAPVDECQLPVWGEVVGHLISKGAE
ncbi:Monophenol monooxygenase [Hyphodiscus hymeniophilus]|uniref:Monophenol monooxygenase n=1 Tax=Hyphodiscus hymeniophilus TaxID=353542 RepID=A0A9P6VMU7_9HELO|nr:Monophenol monooxygenase [Hyphodiscus hymeniophilus]